MNSKTASIEILNERRRLAVKLRVQGVKLARVMEMVELSTPTIIAAHKAFLNGGWDAVDVKPRGRPAGEGQAISEEIQSVIRTSLSIDPANATTSDARLWSYGLLREVLAANHQLEVTERTAGKYAERWGYGAVNGYSKAKTDFPEWLAHPYREISTKARKQSAEVLWVGHKSLDQSTNPETNSIWFAHTTRGKYAWLPNNHHSDAGHLIDFLERLCQHTAGIAGVIFNGPEIDRVVEVQQWLADNQDRLMLWLGPEMNRPATDAIPLIGQSSKITGDVAATQFRQEISIKHKNTEYQYSRNTPTNPTVGDAGSTKNIKHNNTQSTPSPILPATNAPPDSTTNRNNPMTLTHLQRLEAESIHILREVMAESDKPVMLYSIGKDSAVMLHLAQKAFYPAKLPFPLLHVDTGWKFQEMYKFRDKMARDIGFELIIHTNPEGLAKGVNPFTHGSALHTDIMKTEALRQALEKHGFDAAIGGARRDEETARAKERIFSFRTAEHHWDPKNQRPELWNLYNTRKHPGESIRAFPISNWTELDIWQYIHRENIPIVPLYLSAERPVVNRDGNLIMVDDDRMPLNPGEVPVKRRVRFRTLGCYPLTGAIESDATTLPEIIQEMLLASTSERQGRMIDHDSAASMEKKKQEGYF